MHTDSEVLLLCRIVDLVSIHIISLTDAKFSSIGVDLVGRNMTIFSFLRFALYLYCKHHNCWCAFSYRWTKLNACDCSELSMLGRRATYLVSWITAANQTVRHRNGLWMETCALACLLLRPFLLVNDTNVQINQSINLLSKGTNQPLTLICMKYMSQFNIHMYTKYKTYYTVYMQEPTK